MDPSKLFHQQLRTKYGRASKHQCISCDKQAYDWAYQHDDPHEELDTDGYPFSRKAESYKPMCRSCHRKFDLQINPEAREALSQRWLRVLDETRTKGHATQRAAGFPGLAKAREVIHEKYVNNDPEFLAALKRAGHLGGSRRAERMKSDPELAARLAKVSAATAKRIAKMKRICIDCDTISTPAGMGNHLKSSGHSGWKSFSQKD